MFKHLVFLALFQIISLTALGYAQFGEKEYMCVEVTDTTKQLQTNVLTATDRQLYTLKISPGKIVTAACDSIVLYNLTAVLTNGSSDTLNYIDWTGDECIWCFDQNKLHVHPSDFNFCSDADTHNFITYYEILPHQSKIIRLSIKLDGGLSPLDKSFKIGAILQRIVRTKDFNVYHDYFYTANHDLRRQT